MSLESLPLNATHTRYACGIYRLGDEELNYVEVFVTDSGRILPLSGRMLRAEDLMDVYTWGRQDAVSDYAVKDAIPADGGPGMPRAKRAPRVYEPEEEDEYTIGAVTPEDLNHPIPDARANRTTDPSKEGQE